MKWQIRYLAGEHLGMQMVGSLDEAIDEAGRLLDAGRDVRRIEAPAAGCAISADMIRALCARRLSAPVPVIDIMPAAARVA
jgi:hypothetical protein